MPTQEVLIVQWISLLSTKGNIYRKDYGENRYWCKGDKGKTGHHTWKKKTRKPVSHINPWLRALTFKNILINYGISRL